MTQAILEEKDDYARTLEAAGYDLGPKPTDAAPAATTEASTTTTPAPAAETTTTPEASTTTTPAETTATPEKTEAAPATTTTTPATTTAASEELFPGFNALPKEAQEAARSKFSETAQKARDFENRWKAQHGQLAPTQRELEQARIKLREMAEKLQRAPQQASAAVPKLDPKFRENYPDEAAQFDALTEFFTAQLTAIQEQNQALRDEVNGVSSTVTRDRQVATLSQRHSDWQEIDNSEGFKSWLKEIPESKRKLLTSSNANEVADLIDDYKRDLALAQYIVQKEKPATTATPPATTKTPETDPNPTQRRSAIAPNTGTSEADDYAATLLGAGYKI